MSDTVPVEPESGNPPVLLLGGSENAVASARRFVAAGITTVTVNRAASPAHRSRGVVAQRLGSDLGGDRLIEWLLGEGAEQWRGSVLLPLSDRALLGIVDHHRELSEVFRPALFSPKVVTAMLDKQTTVEWAEEAGVGTPRQWTVDGSAIPEDLEYPVVLKPRRNFELIARTGRKYLRADDETELAKHWPTMCELASGFVVNEFIPGGDEQLSSYYAVRDPDGTVVLEFTKCVDRRYPTNQGGATFHRLRDLPATAAAGRQFFDHIDLVGVGNVEFKTDPRSGALKIIECNHRLTAATALMQDNGIDVAGAVYAQALGRATTAPASIGWGATMWYPIRDLRSFVADGSGVTGWLRRPKRSTYPYFRWSDPGPSVSLWKNRSLASIKNQLRR